MSIHEAFMELVKEPIRCNRFYVVLWRKSQFYGGPQEGGWWGNDYIPEAYTRVDTREEAEALADRIEAMAKELSREAIMEHGRGCVAQLEWCEARGIEDSNSVFGEVGGPDEYYVEISENLPQAQFGDRQWS
jgi:hypothetical protein